VGALACAFATGASLEAQVGGGPTPAGTELVNRATVSWSFENGAVTETAADSAVVVVGQIAGVDLEPPVIASAVAADTAVFAHTLTNLGNGADAFALTATPPAGWVSPEFRHDVDGDGVLSAVDTLLTSDVELDAGAVFELLVLQPVPPATPNGDFALSVLATSRFDGGVSDLVTDTVQVVDTDPSARVGILKTVDRAAVIPGQGVLYTLLVDVRTTGADAISVVDTLPSEVRYEPGSLRIDGVPVSDADDADEGSFLSASNELRIDRAAPDSGTVEVTFRAVLDERAAEGSAVTNRARATIDLGTLGTGTALDDATFTVAPRPLPLVRKSVLAADPVVVGDSVVYRIEIENPSSEVPVVDLVLVDTLPQPLELLSAIPSPTSDANGVLRWTGIDLAAGETLAFELTTRVGDLEDEVVFRNVAVLTDGSRTLASDSSESRTARPNDPETPAGITLLKEVSDTTGLPGDTLTYTLSATVVGGALADTLSVGDSLPAGLAYVPGSLTLDGLPLTDAADADAGTADAATGRIGVVQTNVLTGETRVVTFRAVVLDEALGSDLTNRARGEVVSAGTTTTAADSATTGVRPVALGFTKVRTSLADTLLAGDTATWEIRLRNETGRAVRDVTVRDVLPAALSPLDADPTWDERPGAADTLVWRFPRLDAGEARTIRVRALADTVGADTTVVNRAALSGRGVTPATAGSDSVTVLAPRTGGGGATAGLDLTLEAERLEVEPGDRLPLIATVENDGEVAVRQIRVDVRVPEGSRFFDQEIVGAFSSGESGSPAALPTTPAAVGEAAEDGALVSATGTTSFVRPDSVIRTDSGFSLFLPAALAPGERFEFGYRILILTGAQGTLLSEARAEGRRVDVPGTVETSVVASAVDFAEVRLARARALESRMIVGRVWVDLDGDGRASEDEPGVAGVDIWTEDGDVVRTDAAGRYSLVNVRPGRHVLRLDVETLPAGLALADEDDVSAGSAWVETTGWLTGRADFAVVPTGPDAAALDDTAPAAASGAETALPATASADEELADTPAVDPLRVDALRADSVREAEGGNSFLAGPGVLFFAPVDGAVVASNKVFVGVRGEPNHPVRLLRGDSLIAEARLRPDGVWDFIGTEVVEGPQVLRVEMTNSWGQTRTDSLRIHRSGAPVRLEGEEAALRVTAGGRTPTSVRFRVLDAWGVPVANRPVFTLEGSAVVPAQPDVDANSVGHQLRADAQGWLEVAVAGGMEVGTGELVISNRSVERVVPVEVVADARPLFVNGAAQVTIGSGSESFGALTARGSLDERTSLTVSYDSRSLDQDREAFGRVADPLAEDRYTLSGDASEQRSVVASQYSLYAKIERDLDWAVFGDIREGWFTGGLGLGRYTRAVPGAAARITTGGVVWNAFGALTSQALTQQQFRGNGTSGPFDLGGRVLPGSDRVTLESRAIENASRIVSEETLERFVDYEVDYEAGLVLLKRILPATDAFGNPLFLVVTFEREGGGEESVLLGVRGETDLARRFGLQEVQLPFAASVVYDGAEGSEYTLGSVSAGWSRPGGASLNAEIAASEGFDSTGVATRIEGTLPLFDDRLTLRGRWGHIGDEFTNPSNAAVRAGVREVQVGARLDTEGFDLGVDHEAQDFTESRRERSRTTASLQRKLAERLGLEFRVTNDRSGENGQTSNAAAAEVEMRWDATERLDLIAEGRDEIWTDGLIATLGSYLGAGASYRLSDKVSLEARQRWAQPGGDADDYSVTRIGLSSEPFSGTEAYGTYQLAGTSSRFVNAAVVGLNHQLTLGSAWRLQGSVERRDGIANAAPGDVVLASPFEQEEEDYLGIGVGAEFAPAGGPVRGSVRAETRDGTNSRANLLRVAADLSLSEDLGILTRQEIREQDGLVLGSDRYTRERVSRWGLAFRPTDSNTLAFLAQFVWRDLLNPNGRTLFQAGGEETRMIGALEALWSPTARLELDARFAFRDARSTEPVEGGTLEQASEARFIGAAARLQLTSWLATRLTARGLQSELEAGGVWDVFPAIILSPGGGFDIESGYHFGDLEDPDFAIRSGRGWYATFGLRINERWLGSVNDLFRDRF
jgi:uncharacterized repeat protein (TIGR01451 family)